MTSNTDTVRAPLGKGAATLPDYRSVSDDQGEDGLPHLAPPRKGHCTCQNQHTRRRDEVWVSLSPGCSTIKADSLAGWASSLSDATTYKSSQSWRVRHHRGEGLRSKQSAHFGENPALWHSGDHSEIALGYHRSRFDKNMLAGVEGRFQGCETWTRFFRYLHTVILCLTSVVYRCPRVPVRSLPAATP